MNCNEANTECNLGYGAKSDVVAVGSMCGNIYTDKAHICGALSPNDEDSLFFVISSCVCGTDFITPPLFKQSVDFTNPLCDLQSYNLYLLRAMS